MGVSGAHAERVGGLVAYATSVQDARPGHGEDRVAVVELPDRVVFAIADGAGGVSGGAAVADAVCSAVGELAASGPPANWATWLAELDRRLVSAGPPGLAAAVVIEVADDGAVAGASIGDCEAWLLGADETRQLTVHQRKKPLLGSGEATPIAFSSRIGGRLVVATDGLWKYMDRKRIAELATRPALDGIAASLTAGVRLRSGALQDDVAVLACELRTR